MSAIEEERRHAMVRLRAGDYLLLSNDAETLWRLSTYAEDGSAYDVLEDGRERPIVGTFWSAWRYRGTPEEALALDSDEDGIPSMLEWEHWREWSFMHRSRTEAIASAMRAPAGVRR